MYQEHILRRLNVLDLVAFDDQVGNSFHRNAVVARSYYTLVDSFLHELKQRSCFPPVIVFLGRLNRFCGGFLALVGLSFSRG